MKQIDNVNKLVVYIKSLPDFPFIEDTIYDHMGALITDAMLQAGVNYEYTVKPRIDKVLGYPEATNTSGFLSLIHRLGAGNLLDWKESEKTIRVEEMAKFLVSEHVETVADLKEWLQKPGNVTSLGHQRGVGPKTQDYIQNLAGLSTSAIDRHLDNFLELAGIQSSGYDESQDIINQAAHNLGVSEHTLDHSIWKYQSKNSKSCA